MKEKGEDGGSEGSIKKMFWRPGKK